MEEKSEKREYKNYSSKEKVEILKRHLVDRVPVSDLSEKYGIHPNLFYLWQKKFFENGEAAFEKNKPGERKNTDEKTILFLKEKIKRKDEVLAELMEEHINLKKSLGEI